MTTANEIRAIMLKNAADCADEKLVAVLNDSVATWEVIRTIAYDENYLPVVLKENNSGNPRTNVSTMKANLARRNQLVGWIANENALGFGRTFFIELYEDEVAILDAYAALTVCELFTEDNTVLNYVFSLKAEREEARKANRSEAAKKAAGKRKETVAKRKREFEEAKRAKMILDALIAQGSIDPDEFDLREPCEGGGADAA